MAQITPFIMFVALFILLLLKVPVAFALFLVAVAFSYVFWGFGGLYVCFQGVVLNE